MAGRLNVHEIRLWEVLSPQDKNIHVRTTKGSWPQLADPYCASNRCFPSDKVLFFLWYCCHGENMRPVHGRWARAQQTLQCHYYLYCDCFYTTHASYRAEKQSWYKLPRHMLSHLFLSEGVDTSSTQSTIPDTRGAGPTSLDCAQTPAAQMTRRQRPKALLLLFKMLICQFLFPHRFQFWWFITSQGSPQWNNVISVCCGNFWSCIFHFCRWWLI